MNQKKTNVKKISPRKWESYEIDKQMESKHSIVGYLESIKIIELKILRYFNGLRRSFKNMYVCQQRIADKLGITREYCNKVIARLVKMGLLHKLKRCNSRTRIKGTCYYRLPLVFNYKYVTDALYSVAIGFSLFSLSLLSSAADHKNSINALAECFPSEFTQYNLSLNETTITTVSNTVTERGTCPEDDSVPEKNRKKSIAYVLRNKPKPLQPKNTPPQGYGGTGESRTVIFTQEARQSGPIASIIIEDLTKALRLTQAGQVRFTSFPDDVIREALAGLRKAKGIKTPYAWTLDVCKKICSSKGLRPDWSYSRNLKYTLQIPEDQPEFTVALPVHHQPNKLKTVVSAVLKTTTKQQQQKYAATFDATKDKSPWHKCIRLNQEIETGTTGLQDYCSSQEVINPVQDMMIKLMNSMIDRWTAELEETIKEIDSGVYGLPEDWSL